MFIAVSQKVSGIPRQCINGKREEMTNYKFPEDRVYGCQQEEQYNQYTSCLKMTKLKQFCGPLLRVLAPGSIL